MVIDTLEYIGLISLLTLFCVPIPSSARIYDKPKLLKLGIYLSIIFITIGILTIIVLVNYKIENDIVPIIPTGFTASGVGMLITSRFWDKNMKRQE